MKVNKNSWHYIMNIKYFDFISIERHYLTLCKYFWITVLNMFFGILLFLAGLAFVLSILTSVGITIYDVFNFFVYDEPISIIGEFVLGILLFIMTVISIMLLIFLSWMLLPITRLTIFVI